METAYASFEVVKAMVGTGNPNSVTDAGVGALCVRTAILGAFMNVRINTAGYDDKLFVNEVLKRGRDIESAALQQEKEILSMVNEKIGI
jgi:glutamate formiminotransferase/formiminotetrahydrofolate cyclodeaminase